MTWLSTSSFTIPASKALRTIFSSSSSDLAAESELLRLVLSSTDSISDVVDCGSGIYEATSSSKSSFPLVKIRPRMKFEMTMVNPNTISMSLLEVSSGLASGVL